MTATLLFSISILIVALFFAHFSWRRFVLNESPKKKRSFLLLFLVCLFIAALSVDTFFQVGLSRWRSNVILAFSGAPMDVEPGWSLEKISFKSFAEKKRRRLNKACTAAPIKLSSERPHSLLAPTSDKTGAPGFSIGCSRRSFVLMNQYSSESFSEVWEFKTNIDFSVGRVLQPDFKLPLPRFDESKEASYQVVDVLPLSTENWIAAVEDESKGVNAYIFNRADKKITFLHGDLASIVKGENGYKRFLQSVPLNRFSDIVLLHSQPMDFSKVFEEKHRRIISSRSDLILVDRVSSTPVVASRIKAGLITDFYVNQESIYIKMIDLRDENKTNREKNTSYFKLTRIQKEK